ncbi:hypothetical protein HYH02_011960 [Chlamydomonas schloesseri]|uniref:ApaG domain-containing protein n=1 Tax=Chlamydomonas schloesseri TaxID=2026947 RepID=A0A835W164_9CHLO|nr:hypothetical protein HYH02_011960 [Chlamydomonas schloesseri]|eukprot:KAG2435460.1 hypothetical protein HYH02_011960 [Chlamydomonas schloesseri]
MELTPQCLAHVFSQLPARDAARAACVQRLWRDLVQQDERLWKHYLQEDLGISTKAGPDFTEAPTYRSAYVAWRNDYSPEYWPFLPRAIRAWAQIKGWLEVNYPAIRASIQDGTSEAEVRSVEALLGFSLPPALKVIYRLHNGQALLFDASRDRRHAAAKAARAGVSGGPAGAPPPAGGMAPESEEELGSIFHGLFGGYSVYSHLVVSRLMPLRRAAMWTQELELHKLRPQLLAFACSFRVRDKMFVADGATGGLAVARRGGRGMVLQPAAPAEDSAPGAKDGVLRWFEEYARRLAAGYYEVAVLDEEYAEGSRAICLFPLQPPEMRQEVTRGVRVRASVVYAPEESPAGKHLFAYTIRFALQDTQAQLAALPPGSSAAQCLSRCQLSTRHWRIRDERGEVADEVRGEGVIGKHPLLEAGGAEFAYCSCTHQAAPQGSMEGEFRFVEGSLERQLGAGFDVVCPRFDLQVPPFIF